MLNIFLCDIIEYLEVFEELENENTIMTKKNPNQSSQSPYRSAPEQRIYVWYKDLDGNIIDNIIKRDLVEADYFLCRQLQGRATQSMTSGIEGNTKTCVMYFGTEGLIGVAAQKP